MDLEHYIDSLSDREKGDRQNDRRQDRDDRLCLNCGMYGCYGTRPGEQYVLKVIHGFGRRAIDAGPRTALGIQLADFRE